MNKVTLNLRDAFWGGRTENIAAYYKVHTNEEIKYTDFAPCIRTSASEVSFQLGENLCRRRKSKVDRLKFKQFEAR